MFLKKLPCFFKPHDMSVGRFSLCNWVTPHAPWLMTCQSNGKAFLALLSFWTLMWVIIYKINLMLYLIRLKVVTGPIDSLYWGHREKEAEEHFPINFCTIWWLFATSGVAPCWLNFSNLESMSIIINLLSAKQNNEAQKALQSYRAGWSYITSMWFAVHINMSTALCRVI